MGLRRRIRGKVTAALIAALERRGYRIERHDMKGARSFIARFRENYVPVALERIGGDGDGGYLMPPDFDGIDTCFSPGVDDKITFETVLAETHGITSFLADASVDGLPVENDRLHFEKLFLGAEDNGVYTTLASWVGRHRPAPDHDMILQMDVEGAEYDVLLGADTELLSRFRIIVLEFHELQWLEQPFFLRTATRVFEKLYRTHCIVHAHPNNHTPLIAVQDMRIPRLLEVTFLRRDRLAHVARCDTVTLPHPLDRTNVPSKPDFTLPREWWPAG